MIARILTGIVGILMGLSAVNWLTNPAAAAEGLGMPLLEGMGRSTQIGDFSAFFVAVTTFCVLGVVRQKAHWVYSAALVLGLAAALRTLAWLVHGAPFAVTFIAVEVICAALLVVSAVLMNKASLNS